MIAAATSLSPGENGDRRVAPPTFAEALRFWTWLGFISFGGPAGQIAIMQTELVEKRRWIGRERFQHALNFCMLLPGPEAQQLAIYIGWLLHGTAGGIFAGALFVLPSIFILWGLSAIYAAYGSVPWIAAIFYGLKPAIMAIVAVAVIRIGRKALQNSVMWGIAALAFAGIFFFHIPFPIIVLGALLLGFVGGMFWNERFAPVSAHEIHQNPSALEHSSVPEQARPTWHRSLRVAILGLAIWWMPVLLVGLWLGWTSVPFQEGLFFSKAAVVTFGGAYAVLPYVAQQAVETYGWLQPGQMMDGLGLAETTPGPLIMVLQFVGFMGGYNQPGAQPPLLAATLGALITTWVTFVPCFLWIFLGAPHVEQLRDNRNLTAALSAVTAAVVGVILNLAIWFGWHVLITPSASLDWFALGVGLLAFVGLLWGRWNVVPVVLGSGLAGLAYRSLL
ncbi:MAG: chromate efflux transporter [Verrucomicrobiota bacterium]|nr:chromate efflux transporter [Verrucomicrobiota bacterium]